MAKRKRLAPAAIVGETVPDGPLETKSTFMPQPSRRAPIADVTGDAAQRSAFEKVAEELSLARQEGRLQVRLPIAAIDDAHLVRDRIAMDDEDMAALRDSISARGQQMPIEVVDLENGQYGLISGWRRLTALRGLAKEDPEAFGSVLASVRVPETAADAYRAMVEENEIRADLSFYERARICVESARQGIYQDTKEAVQSLFSAAPAPRRSKIASFTVLVAALDSHLKFPTFIPEKLGLPLVALLQSDPAAKERLIERLRLADAQDPQAERLVLEQSLKPSKTVTTSPANRGEAIARGIHLKSSRGKVALSGPGVDAALLADLRDWLKTR